MSRRDSDFDQNIEDNEEIEDTVGFNNRTDFGGSSNSFDEETNSDDYQVVYNENNSFSDKIKNIYYENKKIILLVLFIIIIFIIILLLRGCSGKNGKFNEINIDINDTIYVGETTKFTASASGSGNLKDTEYTFELSDDSKATLSEDSLKGKKVTNEIKGLSSGEVNIIVKGTYNKNSLDTSKSVLICKRFNSDAIILSELKLKQNQGFSLKENINTGVSKCKENLEFTSSDNSVLVIDSNGYATAKKTGSTIITVTDGNNKYTFKVNVVEIKNSVTGIKLNKSSISMKKGDSTTVTATISPANATIRDVKWTSSNESVVTVKNGKITAVGLGTAKVTATTVDGNKTASVQVTVYNSTGVTKPTTSSLCKTVSYTGKAQQLTTVTKTTEYTLSNYNQTNAGTYTITAKLNSGYKWADGSTKNVTFNCTMSKANPSIKVIIKGTNKVGNTLLANVTTNSTGKVTYQWWYKSGNNTTKITNATSSVLTLTSSYIDKYIGVDISIAESANYNKINGSDITDKSNNGNDTVVKSDGTTYSAPSAPTITANDKLSSGKTHNSSTTLTFSSSVGTKGDTVIYYYGTDKNKLTNIGSKVGPISTNGTTTYYVKACSSGDTTKCSAVSSYKLVIAIYNAPTKPTITAADGLASGATHSGTTTLTFSGSTISGSSGSVVYYYGTSKSNITNKANSVTPTNKSGTTTYYVKACNSGDTSKCSDIASYTLVIAIYNAPTKPTITAADGLASGATHSSTTTLSFSGSTISSGLGSVVYYYGTSENNMTAKANSVTPTNTSGTTTYYVKACNSGDTSKCSAVASYKLIISIAVYNAPTKPTITATDGLASGATHSSTTTLSFSGSKISSGSGSVVYYYGTSKSNITNKANSVTPTNTSGTTTYYVKACNSGDTSKCSDIASYTLVIAIYNAPTSAPTITASDNKASNAWHTANFNLTFSGSSISSGLGSVVYYYSVNGDTYQKASSNLVSISSETKGTTFTVKACNSIATSKCSSTATYVVKLDKTAPTCKLKVTTSGVIFDTKSDNLSLKYFGMGKSTTADYNSTTTLSLAKATFYGYVKDEAGLTGSCSATVSYTHITTYYITYKTCHKGYYYNTSTCATYNCYKDMSQSSCTPIINSYGSGGYWSSGTCYVNNTTVKLSSYSSSGWTCSCKSYEQAWQSAYWTTSYGTSSSCTVGSSFTCNSTNNNYYYISDCSGYVYGCYSGETKLSNDYCYTIN